MYYVTLVWCSHYVLKPLLTEYMCSQVESTMQSCILWCSVSVNYPTVISYILLSSCIAGMWMLAYLQSSPSQRHSATPRSDLQWYSRRHYSSCTYRTVRCVSRKANSFVGQQLRNGFRRTRNRIRWCWQWTSRSVCPERIFWWPVQTTSKRAVAADFIA